MINDHIDKWNMLKMIIGTMKKNLVAGVMMMTIMMNRRKILVTIIEMKMNNMNIFVNIK